MTATSIGSFQKFKLTLCLIKPDITKIDCKTKALQKVIRENGFFIIRSSLFQLSREEAQRFYFEHRERFFFNRLVSFMSSGPVWAHILAHPDSIQKWRKLMGPTKVYRAVYEAPNTIRGRFGLTDTRNTVHGSDSEESAYHEIKFYFPNFVESDWRLQEERFFAQNINIVFDYRQRVHRINRFIK